MSLYVYIRFVFELLYRNFPGSLKRWVKQAQKTLGMGAVEAEKELNKLVATYGTPEEAHSSGRLLVWRCTVVSLCKTVFFFWYIMSNKFLPLFCLGIIYHLIISKFKNILMTDPGVLTEVLNPSHAFSLLSERLTYYVQSFLGARKFIKLKTLTSKIIAIIITHTRTS